MLVISRRKDEMIVITKDGEVIGTVSVLQTRSDKARIGFEFLDEYRIDREEVHHTKRLNRIAAEQGAQNGARRQCENQQQQES